MKTLLFDFDGTLVDTNGLLGDCLSDAIHVLTGAICLGMRGDKPTTEQLKERGLDPSLAKTVRAVKFQLYANHIRAHGLPRNEELRRTLLTLRQRGRRMAVVTNSPAFAVLEAFMAAGLGGDSVTKTAFWDAVIPGDNCPGRGKPHPDLYRLALEHMRLKPEDVVVFEDSDVGIEAARAAGIKDIILTTHATLAKDISKCVL